MNNKLVASVSVVVITMCVGIAIAPYSRHAAKQKQVIRNVGSKTVDPISQQRFREIVAKITPLLEEAHQELVNSHYAHSEALYLKVLSIDPSHSLAYMFLTEIFIRQKRYIEAIRTCERITGLYTSVNGNHAFLLKYAMLRANAGDWEKAVHLFQRVYPSGVKMDLVAIPNSTFDADHPDIIRFNAVCNLILGVKVPGYTEPMPGELLEHLRTAIELQPHFGAAHLFMARCMDGKLRYNEAFESYSLASKYGDGAIKEEADLHIILHKNYRAQHPELAQPKGPP